MNYKINIYDKWNIDIILKIEIRSISKNIFNNFISDIKTQMKDRSYKKERCLKDSMILNHISYTQQIDRNICFSTKDIEKVFNYDCECLNFKSMNIYQDRDEIIIRSNRVKFMITVSDVLNVTKNNDFFELSETYLSKDEILNVFSEMFNKHLKGKDVRVLVNPTPTETQEKFIG